MSKTSILLNRSLLCAPRSSFRYIQLLLVSILLLYPSGLVIAQPAPPPIVPAVNLYEFSETPWLSPEYSGCAGQVPGVINAAYEQEVVELVNAERSSRGLPPFKRVDLLDQAARYYAADMYQDNYFPEDHGTYDRQGDDLVPVCAWSTRISNYYSGSNALSENIALGYGSPQSVMSGWMNSTGHRNNILSTVTREIGVGYYIGNYWVQDFGRRDSVYPIVINNEAAETDSRDVSLYIYGDASTWTEMRLRNDSLSWTGWMPFQNTLPWQLPDLVGTHTVSLELRKGGTTTTSNDSIYLTTASTPELGNLPDSLSFMYDLSTQQFISESTSITPLNVGNSSTLTWETTQEDDWLLVSPLIGDTPQQITITPSGAYTRTAIFTDTLMITVTNPDGTLGSPHLVDLTLTVIEQSHQVFLPNLMGGNP